LREKIYCRIKSYKF